MALLFVLVQPVVAHCVRPEVRMSSMEERVCPARERGAREKKGPETKTRDERAREEKKKKRTSKERTPPVISLSLPKPAFRKPLTMVEARFCLAESMVATTPPVQEWSGEALSAKGEK